jgi:hypothetical protein
VCLLLHGSGSNQRSPYKQHSIQGYADGTCGRVVTISAFVPLATITAIITVTTTPIDDSDTALQFEINRARLLDIPNEYLVKRVEHGEIADRLEDVIAAAGQEVNGNDCIRPLQVDIFAAEGDADQSFADFVLGVILDPDAPGHLQEARDGLPVHGVDAAHDALKDGPEHSPAEIGLHHGVAEGEGGQHFAPRDGALVDGGADPAGVDDGEGGVAAAV